MSDYGDQARSGSGHPHYVRHSGGRERSVRSMDADKDRTVLCCNGPAAPQIYRQRGANIRRQRQPLDPITLPADNQLARTPVKVVETQFAHLAGTSLAARAASDREVPSAGPCSPTPSGQQTLDFLTLQRSR